MTDSKKPWGGRFTKSGSEELERYWNSLSFDQKLARYDISGSIAHARMLGKCGVISADEAKALVDGLKGVLKKIESGSINFNIRDEDIHMAVEKILHSEIGAVAGKLHTARSRNDQVALDMHLFVREHCVETAKLLGGLQDALLEQAKQHRDTILPGYTHLQRAQPVLLAHHLLVYVSMLQRDISRLQDTFGRANISPLGAGALAGTTFPIEPEYTAELLKFDGVYPNSMDAVSDRDFSLDFLAASAQIMVHLSRLCEETLLWTSYEFGFATLDDSYSTGSSIMPQKKNSDLAELVRAKSGRVFGSLVGLLTVLKGLPLTYNKDMQEDKEGLFDTVQTIQGALTHLAGMVRTMTFNTVRMKDAAERNFTNATDLADYLAKKGMPFREAHEVAGKMVLACLTNGCELNDLALPELKTFSALFEADVSDVLKLENIVRRRNSTGGTSPEQVEKQFAHFEQKLAATAEWINARSRLLEMA